MNSFTGRFYNNSLFLFPGIVNSHIIPNCKVKKGENVNYAGVFLNKHLYLKHNALYTLNEPGKIPGGRSDGDRCSTLRDSIAGINN